MASHNKTSWSPGYYYDDRQLFEQLQAQSQSIRQLSDQLQAQSQSIRQLSDHLQSYTHLNSTALQRISGKNVIIYNLQDNFNRERSAWSSEIEKYKWKLVVEKQKTRAAAYKHETVNNSEQEKTQYRESGAEIPRSRAGSEEAKEQKLASFEAKRHETQHQILLPKPHDKDPIKVLAPQEQERAASQNPQEAETESWQSARETISPTIEFVLQQEPIQAQRMRKRKRALRR